MYLGPRRGAAGGGRGAAGAPAGAVASASAVGKKRIVPDADIVSVSNL